MIVLKLGPHSIAVMPSVADSAGCSTVSQCTSTPFGLVTPHGNAVGRTVVSLASTSESDFDDWTAIQDLAEMTALADEVTVLAGPQSEPRSLTIARLHLEKPADRVTLRLTRGTYTVRPITVPFGYRVATESIVVAEQPVGIQLVEVPIAHLHIVGDMGRPTEVMLVIRETIPDAAPSTSEIPLAFDSQGETLLIALHARLQLETDAAYALRIAWPDGSGHTTEFGAWSDLLADRAITADRR